MKWTYCGGATALLGRLIAKGTGEKLPDYARRVLFDPMGFGPSEWAVGADGEPRAASGCRLLPRDMLKLGQLALAGGAWQGKQIVPTDWVKRITTPTVKIEGPRSYGYHWYIYDNMVDGQRQYWFGGIGWGGQKLYVFPGPDLVVAMNCGNYRKPGMEQNRVNLAVLNDVVFPSLLTSWVNAAMESFFSLLHQLDQPRAAAQPPSAQVVVSTPSAPRLNAIRLSSMARRRRASRSMPPP